MLTVYKCEQCGATFSDQDDCLYHERQHELTFDMAFKILAQADLDKDIGKCSACPRITPDCRGCLEQAKCVVVKAILDLPQNVREMLG